MYLAGEPIPKPINEMGQAFFQNLHSGDTVKLDIDFSEPYKPLSPDSNYIIEPNGKIDLAVALQGISKVQGKVLYNEAPLSGVIVQVDNVPPTTSDSTGWFSITIPDSLQRESYKVWVIKKGFKTKSEPATPQIGESLPIILEKQ